MSQRIQSITHPVAGEARTTGFVNVYQAQDGNIELGSKMFRQRVNAEAKGNAYSGPLEYIKTIEVSTSVALD
jgi:hypothetical protein